MKHSLKFLVAMMVMVPAMSWARGSTMSGIFLAANIFMYNQTTQDAAGNSADANRSIYDLKGGYLNGDGLYGGVIHTRRNYNATGLTSVNGQATGVSLGYIGDSGFYIMGHYYLMGSYDDYKEVSGYQGDFGYLVNVTGSFYVGVELTYRSLDYKKNDNAAVGNITMKELFPMLTVAFIF